MRGHPLATVAILTAVFAIASTAAGCGDDETTTTSSTSEAQQLAGVAGTALEGACTSVGDAATQAIDAGGENVEQALSQAAKSCRSAVGELPAGQAQDALSQLCTAIAGAG